MTIQIHPYGWFAAAICIWLNPITPTFLDHPELTESSGVAVGSQKTWVLWSHNDSGDSARLFAFKEDGTRLGVAVDPQLTARDWEDMCSFAYEDRHFLAVGDVGDNLSRRESVNVHVFVEPDIKELSVAKPFVNQDAPSSVKLKRVLTLEITYEHGPANCEGLAYDPLRKTFVLATKENFRCRLYEVPMPNLTGPSEKPKVKEVRAKQAQSLVLPLVTGIDISPTGTQIVFCTYGPGVLLTRENKSQPWSHKLGFEHASFALPPRKQGESICFTRDESQLLLTSEFAPCPLFQVDMPSAAANPIPELKPEK
ncbi:MAG: hypothetical protein AB8B50_10600 [Pirellulaceae bacterium]